MSEEDFKRYRICLETLSDELEKEMRNACSIVETVCKMSRDNMDPDVMSNVVMATRLTIEEAGRLLKVRGLIAMEGEDTESK